MKLPSLIIALFAICSMAQAGTTTECKGYMLTESGNYEVSYKSQSSRPCFGLCPGMPDRAPIVTKKSTKSDEVETSERGNYIKQSNRSDSTPSYSLIISLDEKGEPVDLQDRRPAKVYRKSLIFTASIASPILPSEGVDMICRVEVQGLTFDAVKEVKDEEE